ncbi:hypothetical protein BVX98_07700 [bacterium F11]|nr:hypothetical protein BVX98_07700 [bacterium F11]
MGNKVTNHNANIFVEFVLTLPLFILIVVFVIGVSTYFLTKQRALAVARFGAMLKATDLVDDQTVLTEMKAYQKKINPSGPLQWTHRLGRYQTLPSARFYHLVYAKVSVGKEIPILSRFLPDEKINIGEWVVLQKKPDGGEIK